LAQQSGAVKFGENKEKIIDQSSSEEEEGAIKSQPSIFGQVSKDVGEAWLRQLFD